MKIYIKKLSKNLQLTINKVLSKVLLFGKTFFNIFYGLLLNCLLTLHSVLQPQNHTQDTSRKKSQKEDLFPIDCPEAITLPIKERISICNENPAGSFSFLKKDDLTYSLAIWRDQFLKDMYLSTLYGYKRVKFNHTEKFIFHKLEQLRDKWPDIDPNEIQKGGLSNQILPKFYAYISDPKVMSQLWDWRGAYKTENPHSDIIDSSIMDRVERDYPNFGDKIRIKPEHRTRYFADSRAKDAPNFTTEEEFNNPALWEGVVIGVRNTEDMMIKIRMLQMFWQDPDEDDDYSVIQASLDYPIDYVDGLGAATYQECDQVMSYFYVRDPYYTIYGMPRKSIPDYE